MGLFDGAFGGGGTGILPDWLWQNPQAMAQQPNAMAGGSPAGSFADMWSGVSAMPRMQSVESSPLSIPEMLGGGRMAYSPQSQPAINPFNAGDERGAPQPALQAAPSAAQAPAEIGFGDRLLAGLLSFGNSGAPIPAIANLIGGLATGQRTDPMAMALAQRQLRQQPADILEYEYAKGQGYKGTLQDWIANKRAGAGEYGLNPIYGVDAQGNPTVMQLGKGGVATQSKLPEGVKISKDPIKLDAGTHWVILDPTTRQPVATVPKDLAGAERQKELGQAGGKAEFDLPRIEQNAEQALQTINQIRNHPGKQYSVGVPGIVPGVPGTQQKDFVSLVDQAKGKAFLEAFNSLKGGGQITEVEGKKATDAIARLDRTQSKEGFEQALKDLESVIRVGIARARQQAGKGGKLQAPDPLGIR
jgi:hypothetical protein